MRVAAIYDIHGNLPALEAVLQEIARVDVDLIVVGGDVVAGPMPRQTLVCLLELGVPVRFIQGNADREIVSLLAGTDLDTIPEDVAEMGRWIAQQLLPEHVNVMADWPATLEMEVSGLASVLFCHATPRSDSEVFTRLTPERQLLAAFDGLNVSLVVCGHTHMQFDRRVGRTRVVNSGSVGMPYGDPGAYWLLLGPDVQFRRTHYDLMNAATRIRNTSYPRAHDFAENNVLQLPTEEDALKAFTEN